MINVCCETHKRLLWADEKAKHYSCPRCGNRWDVDFEGNLQYNEKDNHPRRLQGDIFLNK